MTSSTSRSPRFDRLKTEPGLLRNTLITVALLVLATVVGSVILGNQRFIAPWEDRQEFYATFAATPGISPGNGQEVRIHGVIVGDIVEAGIDADGNARVKLSVEGRYPVYENATLLLRPKSPLNEMYITMNPGSPPAERVVDG
ncbi:MAG: MlaD family protein, partial [Pseudonocardia sp.]